MDEWWRLHLRLGIWIYIQNMERYFSACSGDMKKKHWSWNHAVWNKDRKIKEIDKYGPSSLIKEV